MLLGNENIGLYKYQSMIDASNESSFGNWESDVGRLLR